MFSKMKLRLAVHSGLKRLANHVTLVSSHENAPKYQSQRLLGVLPYISYIGICGPKVDGFLAFLM